jgi:flagellar basal-body rod protein FlgB
MSLINTPSINLMERSLDAASLRQKVLSNNIANIDTVNFKRSDVSFADKLQDVLSGNTLVGRTTDPRHIQIGAADPSEVQPSVYTETNTSLRNDGNNVDIDSEMSNLASNQILYDAVTQQLNMTFGIMRYAISEGKR